MEEPRDALSRESFLALAGTSLAAVPLSRASLDAAAPRDVIQRTVDILVTESPVRLYNKRTVYDRARVSLSPAAGLQSFKLKGAKPQYQYELRARSTGSYLELAVRIRLAGQTWKEIDAVYNLASPLARIWVSRGYLHGEGLRPSFCFAALPRQAAFQGNVWFATYAPPDHKLIRQTRRLFQYKKPANGSVKLPLHSGYEYTRIWRTHADGVGHDYVTSFRRNGTIFTEIRESVAGLKVMVANNCVALASGSYCDTDDI